MWNSGLFEVAGTCGISQRGLGDLGVFGRKVWGATRGGIWLRGEMLGNEGG